MKGRETATETATAAATWSVAATTAMVETGDWTAVNSHEVVVVVATPTTTTGPAAPDTIHAVLERGTVITTLTAGAPRFVAPTIAIVETGEWTAALDLDQECVEMDMIGDGGLGATSVTEA